VLATADDDARSALLGEDEDVGSAEGSADDAPECLALDPVEV
jgi:hypothetical protein